MAKFTKISWAHSTFNPWIGCEKVSPACDNCYAEGVAKRMGKALWGKGAPRFFTGEAYWEEPLAWNEEAGKRGEPWRVFCASLCDVMEDRRDLDERREQLFELIGETPHLTWLLLSKRPENFMKLSPEEWRADWPENVWPMTTAENQRRLQERLPHLLKVPAKVRGLSIEPLLGPIILPTAALPCTQCQGRGWSLPYSSADHGVPCRSCRDRAVALGGGPFTARTKVVFDTVQWVIVGGESGGKARPMNPAWVRGLRDQCAQHGVAFHMKQWGEWAPKKEYQGPKKAGVVRWGTVAGDGTFYESTTPWNGHDDDGTDGNETVVLRVGTKAAGRLIDGRLWDQTPQSMVVPL